MNTEEQTSILLKFADKIGFPHGKSGTQYLSGHTELRSAGDQVLNYTLGFLRGYKIIFLEGSKNSRFQNDYTTFTLEGEIIENFLQDSSPFNFQ